MINILETINDFYNYDVITNEKRGTAKSATFPAITVCTNQYINVDHYNYSSKTSYKTNNFSLSRFLRSMRFKGEPVKLSEIEFFKICCLFSYRFFNLIF